MTLENKFSELNNKIKQEKNYINDYLNIECICDNKNNESKSKLIKCFLCHKFQHLSCIYQAKFIKPYICFNCQFMNNHFYLRWKKTIIPAKEIIYSNKWTKDKSLLSKGTKKFKFFLNLNELYILNNEKSTKNDNNSHFLAIIWMTNNGKPFHFGFPDNITIKINNNEFYSTYNKSFMYPLLLSLDNSSDYSPIKRNLITQNNFEIPQASEFFYPPRIINYKKKSSKQSLTISFDNPLENYYGSEFQFQEIRRYLIYLGVFQEIKIPQLSILKVSNKLNIYNDIFKNLYREKVLKIKWNKISQIINLDNEEMNINFYSNISNQKIIHPVRGLFCQHSDVLDFGECCRYISGKNQIYKCYKCNKPLNIMYIDDASEKIFNDYKNKNFSEIYYNNHFKLIKGEKNKITEDNYIDDSDDIKDEESICEDDSLNESLYKFYQKEFNLYKNNKLQNSINTQKNNKKINLVLEGNKIKDESVIELYETISLSNDSEISISEKEISNNMSLSLGLSKDNHKNKNKKKDNNKKYSKENKYNFSIIGRIKNIGHYIRNEELSFEEKSFNRKKENKLLNKKKEYLTIKNDNCKGQTTEINQILTINSKVENNKNNKKTLLSGEIIDLNKSNKSSFFIPIDIEDFNETNSIQNSSDNDLIEKTGKKNKSYKKNINKKKKFF